MMRVIKLVLAVIMAATVSCSTDVIIVYDISQERFEKEVAALEKEHLKYLIIDTRSEKEYKKGHVIDALNYPQKTFAGKFSELEDLKDVPTFVYGYDADESFKVAKYLAQHGFVKIFNCMGTEETTYDFVNYSPMRLPSGFKLASAMGYQLVDYRTALSRLEYNVPNSNFIPYPNIDRIINSVNYANGYVTFSVNLTNARECAQELSKYGFKNVYYCIDSILDYPDFYEFTARKLDTGETE